jgi:hypothetical protein
MDQSVGTIPETMGGKLVSATSSCIAIGTLSEHDGLTNITLSSNPPENSFGQIVYDGILEIPSQKLTVCSVFGGAMLETVVSGKRGRVRIWANSETEPDKIWIQTVP